MLGMDKNILRFIRLEKYFWHLNFSQKKELVWESMKVENYENFLRFGMNPLKLLTVFVPMMENFLLKLVMAEKKFP